MADIVGCSAVENADSQALSDDSGPVPTPTYDADQEENADPLSPIIKRERTKFKPHKSNKRSVSYSPVQSRVSSVGEIKFTKVLTKENADTSKNVSKESENSTMSNAKQKFFTEMEKAYSDPQDYKEELYKRVINSSSLSKRFASKLPIPTNSLSSHAKIFPLRPVPTNKEEKRKMAVTYQPISPTLHPSAKTSTVNKSSGVTVSQPNELDLRRRKELLKRVLQKKWGNEIGTVFSEIVQNVGNGSKESSRAIPNKDEATQTMEGDFNRLGGGRKSLSEISVRSSRSFDGLRRSRSQSVSTSSVRASVGAKVKAAARNVESPVSFRQPSPSRMRAKPGTPSLKILKQASMNEADCMVCASGTNCSICAFKYFALIFAARNVISVCNSCHEQLTRMDW